MAPAGPIRALSCFDPAQTCPVSERILAMNPLRKAAGLRTVEANWRVAQTMSWACDVPSYEVLLDAQGQPAKVLEMDGGGLLGDRVSHTLRWQEFDVRNGRLDGKMAVWLGTPPKIFKTETYRGDRRNGPSTYYDSVGLILCSCDFRDDQPWNGRMLERMDFLLPYQDWQYRNGKSHGCGRIFDQAGTLQHEAWFWDGEPLAGGEQAFLQRARSE